MSIELLQSMESSITGHFQSSDRKYSTFFGKKAVA